jgi:heme/copper-type cytochrome/quinol oxidase subunit 2
VVPVVPVMLVVLMVLLVVLMVLLVVLVVSRPAVPAADFRQFGGSQRLEPLLRQSQLLDLPHPHRNLPSLFPRW